VRLAALWSLAALLAVFTVLQLLPYGRDHSNLARHTEPPWDSARTRELVVGSCFDCHSNRTDWPWYSYVAPASWLVTDDVHRGREALKFSLWPRVHKGEEAEVEDIFEVVLDESMPPRNYTLAHWDARLSESEELELVQGLRRTFARAGVAVGEGEVEGE
jgi:Haem-binding domain